MCIVLILVNLSNMVISDNCYCTHTRAPIESNTCTSRSVRRSSAAVTILRPCCLAVIDFIFFPFTLIALFCLQIFVQSREPERSQLF